MVPASPLVVFLLVFARVGGGIVAAPVFSEQRIPAPVKAGFTGLVALLLTPGQVAAAGPVPTDPAGFTVLLGEQLLLGLAFALVLTAVVRAAESAGELVGQQMGVTLGTWEQSDNASMHTLAQFYHVLAGLIFLGLDGLHWVVLGLGASFAALPATRAGLPPGLGAALLALGGAAIGYAVGLALPLLATLLLADALTGLLGRALPSLNIFVLGLPLKIALGLVGLLIALPFTVELLSNLLSSITALRLWG